MVVFPNIVLQFGWILNSIFVFFPYAGVICSLVWSAIYFGTICDFIYKRVEGQDNKILSVLSGLFLVILYVKILLWNLPKGTCKLMYLKIDIV